MNIGLHSCRTRSKARTATQLDQVQLKRNSEQVRPYNRMLQSNREGKTDTRQRRKGRRRGRWGEEATRNCWLLGNRMQSE